MNQSFPSSHPPQPHHHHHQGNPNLGEIINFLSMINPAGGAGTGGGGSGPTNPGHLPILEPPHPPPHLIQQQHYPQDHVSPTPDDCSLMMQVPSRTGLLEALPPGSDSSRQFPFTSSACSQSIGGSASGYVPSSPISPDECSVMMAHHQAGLPSSPHSHSPSPSSSYPVSDPVPSSSTSICRRSGTSGGARDKPYACSRCDARFKSLIHLDQHVQAHEESDMRYACLHPGCNRTFINHIILENHMKRHAASSVDKPHCCTVCPKTFKQKAGLLAHMDIHEGRRPHQCTECDKAFRQKTTLEQHRRMHTGERPYECTFCDKTFRQRCHLDQHIRTHTGEKPYQCVICIKSFKQKSGLDNHVRTHTGEKPYRCAVCGSTYKQRSGLLNHMKTHEVSGHDDEEELEQLTQPLGPGAGSDSPLHGDTTGGLRMGSTTDK